MATSTPTAPTISGSASPRRESRAPTAAPGEHQSDRSDATSEPTIVAASDRRVCGHARQCACQHRGRQVGNGESPHGRVAQAHRQGRQDDHGVKATGGICGEPISKPIAALTSSRASDNAAVRSQRRRLAAAIGSARRPPRAAPTRKAAREVDDQAVESPGVPATAKPSKTTLPVMFAVKTWPSPRKLTASTSP